MRKLFSNGLAIAAGVVSVPGIVHHDRAVIAKKVRPLDRPSGLAALESK